MEVVVIGSQDKAAPRARRPGHQHHISRLFANDPRRTL